MGQWWGGRPPWTRRAVAAAALLGVLGCLAEARAAEPGEDGLIDPPAASPPADPPGGSATVTASTARRTHTGGSVIENYTDQIDVPAGQSAIVRLRRPAQRVAIADPEVADVVLVSPTEILVNGKGRRYTSQTGEPIILEAQTSLIVWDKQGVSDVRALYVNRSRSEQVELRVTVAELNRTAMENQGYDFRLFQGGVFVAGTPAKIAGVDTINENLTSPVANGAKNIAGPLAISRDRVTFTVLDLNHNFESFIELLQQEAMAKILARPTLLSRSGEEAHFRSGGEVPIPLVTTNQLAVQFKEFGAIVNFTPTFTDDGSIDLRVNAELSQPDQTLGVSSSGVQVPGFRSRSATTRVRLREAQSLLIAGLLRDDENEDEQKVPYLGDIPYLGALFRRTTFVKTRSELMIMVQPRVVRADQDDAHVVLPTSRPPFSRAEVRTKPTPNPVTRPRLFGPHTPAAEPAPTPPPSD